MLLRSVAALLGCSVLLLVSHHPLAQAQAVAAADTQIMDWVFAMPEGWRVANSRLTRIDTKLLALEHTERCSSHLTQVTFGRPGTFEGTFANWFDGHWKQLNKDYTFADPDKPESSNLLNGYKAIAGVGVTEMPGGITRIVMLIGLNKGDVAGVMCFITEDLEHFEANAGRMDKLLVSATFASQRGKKDPKPKLKLRIDPACTPSFLWDTPTGWPKGDAPLEGLYGMYGMLTDRLYDWGWSFRVGYYYVLFFKDGTAMTRLPPEGLLSLNVDHLKREFPAYFGTYTLKDGVVTVKTGTAEHPAEAVFRVSGDDLRKGENGIYRRIKDDAPKLKGRYLKMGWETHQPEFRKGITFNEDGTFDDEGFNSLLDVRWWYGDAYWLLEQEAEPGTGKWRVEKNTLELAYNDGRRLRYGFHVHVNEKEAKSYVVINSKFLDKTD